MTDTRPSLTFACVYNDLATLDECLAASLAEVAPRSDMELITVDNREHVYSSAGAALNHAVVSANNDVVVLAHQDAFIHDPDLLQTMARHFNAGHFGLLGPVGVDPEGWVIGNMRDRATLIGRSAPEPAEVDSLDEVVMMAPRSVLLEHPLTEDPDLSWHAYGVELSARLRRNGLATGACDLAITHNSRNLNLARLDRAHARVAELSPASLPLRTTCGTIGTIDEPQLPLLRRVRRRAGKTRRSLKTRWKQTKAGHSFVPQVDLREDLHLLRWGSTPLRIVNYDAQGAFHERAGASTVLTRESGLVDYRAVGDIDDCLEQWASSDVGHSCLLTNLSGDDLERLAGVREPYLVGAYAGEYWVLAGPVLDSVPASWMIRS